MPGPETPLDGNESRFRDRDRRGLDHDPSRDGNIRRANINLPEALQIRTRSGGIEVALRILPRSRMNRIDGLHNGALKVRITAPPVEGAANREIIRLFADLLGTAKSKIRILSGEKSRAKVLRIEGVTADAFVHLLSLEDGFRNGTP